MKFVNKQHMSFITTNIYVFDRLHNINFKILGDINENDAELEDMMRSLTQYMLAPPGSTEVEMSSRWRAHLCT